MTDEQKAASDAAHASWVAGVAHGQEAERARVVAEARKAAEKYDDPNMKGDPGKALRAFADRIEAG